MRLFKKAEKRKMENSALPKDLGFGKIYGSHIFQCEIMGGLIVNRRFVPVEEISSPHPASPAINYALSIMDRFKGYQTVDGRFLLIRPYDHLERVAAGSRDYFGVSFDPSSLVDQLCELVRLNRDFIPPFCHDGKKFLYFGLTLGPNDSNLALTIPSKLTLTIFVSPVEEYFNESLRVLAKRMPPRPVGTIKACVNYGPYLLPRSWAKKAGFHDVLHLDQRDGFIEELGAASVFFVLQNGKIITPSLGRGTILRSITRDSVIVALQRYFSREVIVDLDFKLGYILPEITEMLCCGTAVTVVPINTLFHPSFDWKLDQNTVPVDPEKDAQKLWYFGSSISQSLTTQVRNFLVEVYTGQREDIFGWTHEVKMG